MTPAARIHSAPPLSCLPVWQFCPLSIITLHEIDSLQSYVLIIRMEIRGWDEEVFVWIKETSESPTWSRSLWLQSRNNDEASSCCCCSEEEIRSAAAERGGGLRKLKLTTQHRPTLSPTVRRKFHETGVFFKSDGLEYAAVSKGRGGSSSLKVTYSAFPDFQRFKTDLSFNIPSVQVACLSF